MIANDVVAALKEDPMFDEIVAVNPGFINIRLQAILWQSI